MAVIDFDKGPVRQIGIEWLKTEWLKGQRPASRIPEKGILLSQVSPEEQQRIIDAGGAIYVPQKIIMLAAGNDKQMRVLCHASEADIAGGKLGKDAPALTSLDMMKWLCDLPEGIIKVWYAGGYDGSHILKDLPFHLPLGNRAANVFR